MLEVQILGVRARGLFGKLTEAVSASYLSGMLVGNEIRSAHGRRGQVHLLCSAQLAEIYGRAFAVLGIEANALDPDSVTKGLFRLAPYL